VCLLGVGNQNRGRPPSGSTEGEIGPPELLWRGGSESKKWGDIWAERGVWGEVRGSLCCTVSRIRNGNKLLEGSLKDVPTNKGGRKLLEKWFKKKGGGVIENPFAIKKNNKLGTYIGQGKLEGSHKKN